MYYLKNTVRFIESRMRWEELGVNTRRNLKFYRVLWEKMKLSTRKTQAYMCEWITLKWILQKQDGRVWTGYFSSGQGKLAECNEHSVLLKRISNTYATRSFSRTTLRRGVNMYDFTQHKNYVIVNEKRILKAFESTVLRFLRSHKAEVTGRKENCMRSVTVCAFQQVVLERLNGN
jgi:hypothetical protein